MNGEDIFLAAFACNEAYRVRIVGAGIPQKRLIDSIQYDPAFARFAEDHRAPRRIGSAEWLRLGLGSLICKRFLMSSDGPVRWVYERSPETYFNKVVRPDLGHDLSSDLERFAEGLTLSTVKPSGECRIGDFPAR